MTTLSGVGVIDASLVDVRPPVIFDVRRLDAPSHQRAILAVTPYYHSHASSLESRAPVSQSFPPRTAVLVTGQLADAIGDFACLVFLIGSICETASCPVTAVLTPSVTWAFSLFKSFYRAFNAVFGKSCVTKCCR